MNDHDLSPFAICIFTIRGLRLARIADRLFDDRRLDPVSDAVSELDLGTSAEQILNGLYNSYVLLAVPLFVLAPN